MQNQVKNLQDQEKNTQTDPNIKNFDGHVVDTSKSLLENASRNNLWDNYYDNTQDASTWNGNVIPQNIYVSPDNNKTEDHSSLGPAQPNLDYYNTLSQDVDVVNGQMTDAQKQELAILMLNEINHAREQRGLKPFVMTEQKYQQAQVRASQHSAQVLDHNENDIMTAFGQDQYECLAYIPLNDTHSLYDLLNQASNSLSNMLNADASSDWGHRENFLEDTGTLSANAAFGMHLTDDGQYYVLTFDYDLSNPDSTPNMMDRIAQYQAMGPITGDAHTVDNSAQINDLNNQISNLQNTLASQQSHLNDLTTQLQNLQAQKANVQFDLSQLSSDQQAEYNNAKHTLDTINDWKNGQLANINKDGHVQEAINKLSSAKSNYKSAQEAQAQDETNLQQAKDGLASLNQVLATKQVALDTAEQKANAQANQVVKDKQAKLDAIKSHTCKTLLLLLRQPLTTLKLNLIRTIKRLLTLRMVKSLLILIRVMTSQLILQHLLTHLSLTLARMTTTRVINLQHLLTHQRVTISQLTQPLLQILLSQILVRTTIRVINLQHLLTHQRVMTSQLILQPLLTHLSLILVRMTTTRVINLLTLQRLLSQTTIRVISL
ncbi:SEC10/PgrA surface exclusion domain-containing protein [Limosilactobacillus reuteri]|uniref:SEC10/PgrA surface exclusion domain-containing protein n=1 Tax=Limosilactobacillus reuteri TaxID=1598 RepID=UPI003995A6DE